MFSCETAFKMSISCETLGSVSLKRAFAQGKTPPKRAFRTRLPSKAKRDVSSHRTHRAAVPSILAPSPSSTDANDIDNLFSHWSLAKIALRAPSLQRRHQHSEHTSTESQVYSWDLSPKHSLEASASSANPNGAATFNTSKPEPANASPMERRNALTREPHTLSSIRPRTVPKILTAQRDSRYQPTQGKHRSSPRPPHIRKPFATPS